MTTKQEQLQDLSKVVSILAEGGYEFSGIKYDCISSTGHVLSHQYKGVEIKYDRSEMEQFSKGLISTLTMYAYYSNKCFIILR